MPEVARQSGVDLIKNGTEYKALCCFHNDKNPSLSFYNKDGVWKYHCFSCGAGSGGDVISFVQERYSLTPVEAVKFLTGDEERAVTYKCNEVITTSPYDGLTVSRPPSNAPALIAGKRTPKIWNPKRDKFVTYTPSMVHPYKNRKGDLLGYVIRQEFDDRKITPQIVWVTGKYTGWCHGSFNDPRPLYNLPELYSNPSKQVLLVEGEKCADAARIINNVVAMSWAGGARSYHKTHWGSLKGRRVIWWPDAGVKGTAITPDLIEKLKDAGVTEIKIVDSPNKPEEWDIADLIEEGGIPAKFIRDNIRTVWPVPQPAPVAPPAQSSMPVVSNGAMGIDAQNYKQMLLTNSKGVLDGSKVYNWCILLQYEPPFDGMFAWNGFANEIYLMKKPVWCNDKDPFKPRPIKDSDITATFTILETMNMSPKDSMLGKAIVRVAEYNKYNHVKDRLNSLKWDGVKRIFGDENNPCWLSYYLGADNSDINRAFGGRWLISAVARALTPGCKVDTMIILEGDQGLQKSTALKALADSLVEGIFTDQDLDPTNKDSALQMQGKLIVEIAELSSMSRAKIEEVKAWITRREDRFRRPYGKIVENFPRYSVFAGTHNPMEDMGYLKDPTGARRFWPFMCRGIDIEGIKADGEQLWAEAVHMFKQGEQWWLTKEEEVLASKEQMDRYELDPWGDSINHIIAGTPNITLTQILTRLEIPTERRTVFHAKRVSTHMDQIGWTRIKEGSRITFYNPDY